MTLNLSVGALYVTVPATLSASEDQRIGIGFVTDVGLLELSGRIRRMCDLAERGFGGDGSRVRGLALQFTAVSDI